MITGKNWWARSVGGSVVFAALLVACSGKSTSSSTAGAGDDDGKGSADSGVKDAGRVIAADGGCVSNCSPGDKCTSASECASGYCDDKGVCSMPSCEDGKLDGTETSADCGGSSCPGCADNLACLVGSDCTSLHCDATTHLCDAPTSSDGITNGSETDTDCGSSGGGEKDNAPACPDGDTCFAGKDCLDLVCGANGTCLPATCMDGEKNAAETDVDCGGGTCNPCADKLSCVQNSDCTSAHCDVGGTNKCLPPTSKDGITNGNETDTDCGSSGPGEDTMAPACPDGDKCGALSDCVDLVCTSGICAAPTCGDGEKNGNETAVDCGGTCPGCADLVACKVDTDCTSKHCDTTKNTCAYPTNGDGIQNGNETDIDCGNTAVGENTGAAPCAVGKVCLANADCVATPGGAQACSNWTLTPKGMTGANGETHLTQTCLAEPSCVQESGGETCGMGETGFAGSVHESCCASLPIPTSSNATVKSAPTAVRLDKYEITAGRMREFVNRTGGDIHGWYEGFKAAQAAHPTTNGAAAVATILAANEQYLPTANDQPQVNGFKYTYKNASEQDVAATNPEFGEGLYSQIGANVLLSDEPSTLQGCFIGSTAAGEYGHPTYWWTDEEMVDDFGGVARSFSQTALDEKSLNCVTQLMLAAFCAWDGGYLATQPQIAQVWGSSTNPWDNLDARSFNNTISDTSPGRANPRYNYNATGTTFTTDTGSWTVPMANDADGTVNDAAPQLNMVNWNDAYPVIPTNLRYYFPAFPETMWAQADEVYEIAAPGRFVNDVAPDRNTGAPGGVLDGWFDFEGNLMETTSTATGNDGNTNHMPVETYSWTGGSFEGHSPTNKGGYNENMFTKYGKTGGRCAR